MRLKALEPAMSEPKSIYTGGGPQRLPDEAPVAVWRYSDKMMLEKRSWGRMELYRNGSLFQITDSHRAYEGSPLVTDRLFRSPQEVESFVATDRFFVRTVKRRLERIETDSGTPTIEERTPEEAAAINEYRSRKALEEREREEAQTKRWVWILVAVVFLVLLLAVLNGETTMAP